MGDLKHTLDILELIIKIITILGVPTAVLTYFYNRKKDREQKEYLAYDALDEKYIDFLKLCFEHSDLKLDNTATNLSFTPDQQEKRFALFEILISLFERAHIMYHTQSKAIKGKQWTGWVEYMTRWLENENFKTYWKNNKSQYDSNFQEFMENLNH